MLVYRDQGIVEVQKPSTDLKVFINVEETGHDLSFSSNLLRGMSIAVPSRFDDNCNSFLQGSWTMSLDLSADRRESRTTKPSLVKAIKYSMSRYMERNCGAIVISSRT